MPAIPATGEGLKVLLIEDNPGDVDLIRERAGEEPSRPLSITSCGSLQDGIALLDKCDPDVILLDLGLPDSTGLDTFTAMREAAGDTPIIVLTGHDDLQVGGQCIERGAYDYLVKNRAQGYVAGAVYNTAKRAIYVRRQRLHESVLHILNRPNEWRKLLGDILEKIQIFLHIDAVGIRLTADGDYPYCETRGFPADFTEKEHCLCAVDEDGRPRLDEQGKPVLEGMCGNVLAGRTDPSLPFFTKNGSFWTNSTTQFLEETSEEDRQGPTRNWCNHEGYESLALIPLRSGDDIIGLLQLNDRAEGRYDIDLIRFLESLGHSLGIAFKRRQMQEDIEEKTRFTNMMLDTQRDTFFVFEPATGRALRWNRAFRELCGYTDEEIESLPAPDSYYSAEDMKRAPAFIEEVMQNGFGTIEMELICKDGTRIPTEYRVSVMGDESNAPRFFVSIGRDIRERKQSQAHLSQALQLAKAGHWEYDVLEDRFTFNDSFYHVYHTTAEEQGGYHMSAAEYAGKFMHPDDAHMVAEELKRSRESDDPDYSPYVEHRVIYADGGEGYVTVRFSLVKDDQGRTVKTLGINQDITAQKTAEEEIERLARFPSENPNPVLRIAGDGTITYSNGAAASILPVLAITGGQVASSPWKDKIRSVLDSNNPMEEILAVGDSVYLASLTPVAEHHYVNIYARDITERTRTNERLQESEEQFRTLFENMLNAFALHEIILDEAGRPVDYFFLEANHAFEKLTGLKREDVIGKRATEVLPGIEKDPAGWIEKYGHVALTGEEARFESYARPLKRWYSVLAFRQGKHMFATVFEDITERKQAEDTLEHHRTLLEKSQELGHIGTWELDLATSKLVWTDETCRIFGAPEKTVTNYEHFLNSVHPEDREYVNGEWTAALEGGPYDIEHRVLRQDGTVLWVRESADIQRDAHGKPVKATGFTQDISAVKLRELELRNEERNRAALLDYSPACHKVIDLELKLQYMSENGYRMLKLDPAYDLADEPYPFSFFPEEFQKDMRTKIEQVIASGETMTNEGAASDRDGNPLWLHSTIVPVPDDDGNLSYLTIVTSDTTQRRQLEAKLRQSQKLESIGTLAGGVAHEINNPINGIMNYAQLIQDQLEGREPDVNGFASEIIHETQRVTVLVKNLLSFAGREKKQHSLARICDIVDDTLSLIRTVLRHDHITLDVRIPQDLPQVRCRSQQIQQVIMNLVTNARDALNENYPGEDDRKQIKLFAVPVEVDGRQMVRTTVANAGPAIPEEIQRRIFDPFFTTKPRDKGTGLGLAISHGIITEHKGKIHVQSGKGEWTEFHVDLPAAE